MPRYGAPVLDDGQRLRLRRARERYGRRDLEGLYEGLRLLEEWRDPALWRYLAAGLRIDGEGRLEIRGEIAERVPGQNRLNAALWAARMAGGLGGVAALRLTGQFHQRLRSPDLAPLAGLFLERLDLWHFRALDLAPLAQTPGLRRLSLIAGMIVGPPHAEPFAGLDWLEDLWIAAPRPGPLGAVARLPRLRRLHLSWLAPGTDLSPLAAMTGLESLRLTGCEGVDTAPILHLPLDLPDR